MARNLLKNPSGKDQLQFWELVENGGDGWKVEDMPTSGIDIATKFFVTSFHPCLKRQEIDLLARDFTKEQLDGQTTITVEDWYSGRTDCGCTYQMTVRLLDENRQVLQELKPGLVTLDPKTDDGSWKQVSHTINNDRPGLRFITFEHGGKDTSFWKGWYGVRVTASSVIVDV